MLTAILGGFDKKENTLAFLPRVNQHPQRYHSKKNLKIQEYPSLHQFRVSELKPKHF
jgi:hypothetical protein